MRSTNLLTYLLTYFELVTVGCVVVPGVNYKCILLVLLLIDHAQLNIGLSIRGLAWVELRLVVAGHCFTLVLRVVYAQW